jgi:hypothetical protein
MELSATPFEFTGFTSRAKDWEVVYFELIEDKTKNLARKGN